MVNGRGPCLWWPNHLLRPQVVVFFSGWFVFRVVFFLFGSFQNEFWANLEQGKELELWNNNNKVCKAIRSLVVLSVFVVCETQISLLPIRYQVMAWFWYDIHVIVCDVNDGTGRSPVPARTVTGKEVLANSGGIRAAAGDTSMKWEMVHHAKST